jgi:homoaconitase/3-isopropylmalate dehydratase large subunit
MRIEPTRKAIPRTPADSAESAPRAGAGDEISFAWGALVPHVVHPAKVAIVEALSWLETPLSPSELERIFIGSCWSVQLISYHAKALQGLGALEVVEERQVRGVIERLYFFPDGGAVSP